MESFIFANHITSHDPVAVLAAGDVFLYPDLDVIVNSRSCRC